MNINLAKLNHVLIPSTKEGRDRFRRGLLGRATRPFWGLYGALSEEGRVLAVASIVIGAFGLDVQTTDVYVLWAALVGLLGGALLLRRFFPLDGVELEVDAPRRVTVGEPITFSIVLHNRGSRDRHAVRVRGPFLPWDGRFLGASPAVSLLAAGKIARVELAARFVERGEHHLDPFHAAALVPLGLASGEAAASSGCRFLVIPKIAPVARLRLPMGRRYQPGGVALASKSGESMEQHGVRPYRAGDPVRQLHAKSWARVGWPVVREYQEEYFSRVGVIVDAATREPRRLEAILSLAAGVVAHLGRGEALIDLLVVGERIHDLTIGRHLGFLEQALDLLACVRIEAAIEPDRLIAQLARHLAQLSCVVVVAPAWDGGALATRIRGRGVACVTLVVGDAPRADGVWSIDVAALERGEPLVVG